MYIEDIPGRGQTMPHGGRIWQLSPREVFENWEDLCDLLQPAVDASRGDLTTFGLLHACAHEQSYIFVGTFQGIAVAAIVITLNQYHSHRVAHIDGYAGRAALFYDYLSVIEEWARANGCSYLEGHGSEAAQRLAQRRGFKHSHYVYRKQL